MSVWEIGEQSESERMIQNGFPAMKKILPIFAIQSLLVLGDACADERPPSLRKDSKLSVPRIAGDYVNVYVPAGDVFPGPNAAAVVESRIADLKREALVLGNGDLNALMWERDGALCLRVTKNDIWDARIDTSRDPELMTMDIGNRTWQGGFLVSAEQRDGNVTRIEITSTVGGRLRLLSPWSAIAVRRGAENPVALTPDARGVVTLQTRPDEELVLIPARGDKQ
jgi:hypothetical protein